MYFVQMTALALCLWPDRRTEVDTHLEMENLIKCGPFVSENKVDGRRDEGKDKATHEQGVECVEGSCVPGGEGEGRPRSRIWRVLATCRRRAVHGRVFVIGSNISKPTLHAGAVPAVALNR